MTGSEFRKLREHTGLTQSDLSRLFERTVNTISKWERMETVPKTAVLALLWYGQEQIRRDAEKKESSTRETDEEKAARDLTQRKQSAAYFATLPPWDDNERQRRLRLGLPMNEEKEEPLAVEKDFPGIFGNGDK